MAAAGSATTSCHPEPSTDTELGTLWLLGCTLLTPRGAGHQLMEGHSRESQGMRRKALTTSPDGDGAAGLLLQPAPGQHTGDDERDRGRPHQPNPKSPPKPEPQAGGGGREATGQDRLQSQPSMSSQLPARSRWLEPALPCSSGHRARQAVGHPRAGRIRPHSKPSCTPGSTEGVGPAPSATLTPRGTRGDMRTLCFLLP